MFGFIDCHYDCWIRLQVLLLHHTFEYKSKLRLQLILLFSFHFVITDYPNCSAQCFFLFCGSNNSLNFLFCGIFQEKIWHIYISLFKQLERHGHERYLSLRLSRVVIVPVCTACSASIGSLSCPNSSIHTSWLMFDLFAFP